MKYCVLTIAIVCSGCGAPLPSPVAGRVGQVCDVQFRRDALGAAAPNGIPPQTGDYNGASMHLIGTLKKVQPDAILLSDQQHEYLIPMHAILYLKFDETPQRKEPQKP